MSLALQTFILAFGWAAATGNFSLLNLLFGAAVAGFGLFLVRDRVQNPRLLPGMIRLASLAGWFVREVFVSAFRVAVLVVRPDLRKHLNPAIVAFPLTVTSDAEITLLANLITLTPGTLSVDVSEDRKLLFVHVIDCSDRETLIRQIAQGFEAKVLEVFR